MSVTHLRWVKKRNTDTKNDTRILKFFRKKRFKSTIVKRPCCLLLTPLPARLPVTFFWHNADLTSEVTSKMWRQNEEFDSLMSGFTSNLNCMQLAQGLSDFKLVKVKNDLFLKVKTRLNWLLHSGKAFASFPNIRRGVHIQQQLCCWRQSCCICTLRSQKEMQSVVIGTQFIITPISMGL